MLVPGASLPTRTGEPRLQGLHGTVTFGPAKPQCCRCSRARQLLRAAPQQVAPHCSHGGAEAAEVAPGGVDWRQLSNPIKLEAAATCSIAVQGQGGSGPSSSLDAYMALPVEAVARLDPSTIVPLGPDSFQLKLPRISMFTVWVAPEVEVGVQQMADGDSSPGSSNSSPHRVVFQSRACRLPGSPFFQTLEGRFALEFQVELAWCGQGPSGGSSSSSGAGGEGGGDAASQGPSSSTSEGSAGGDGAGGDELRGSLRVEVWSEVAPPFNLVPRGVIQGTCNAVVGSAVQALLPVFMQRLGADYEKWAAEQSGSEGGKEGVATSQQG